MRAPRATYHPRMHRTRRRTTILAGGASLLITACSGAPESAAPRVDPPAPSPVIAPAPAADAPYGVRLLRRCSEWRYTPLSVDARHVIARPGAVHDLATGELVAIASADHGPALLARAGDRTLWSTDEEGHLVVLDAERRPVGAPIALGEHLTSVGSAAGDEVGAATPTRVLALDLARGTQRTLDPRCAGASAITTLDDGALRCALEPSDDLPGTRQTLRVLDASGERAIPWMHGLRFDCGRLVGMREGTLVVLPSEGAAPVTREIGPRSELLDVAGGRALIATESFVVLASLDDVAAPLETVLDERADRGAIAGEDIVLTPESQTAVWLRRGATLAIPRTSRSRRRRASSR